MPRPSSLRHPAWAFVLLCALGACSKDHAASAPAAADPSASATVAEQLATLQQQQKLPTLDVSATVTGTDADANGVRDDIDQLIAAVPDTAIQKKALTQLAQAIQSSLSVDISDSSAVGVVALNLNRADTCVWSVYPSGQTAKVLMLEELTVNTPTRLGAYEAYNAARDGASVSSIAAATACN
jgi:hypothetical protein